MPLSSLVRLLQTSALSGELCDRLDRSDRLLLRGAGRAARALVASAMARHQDRPLLVVVPTLEEAGRWTALLDLMGWRSAQLYPTSEGSPYEPFDPTSEITWGQLQVLSELQLEGQSRDLAIVATERCLQPHLPPPQVLADRCRTLRKGDIFVVGEQWGKVRALVDDKGQRVDEAGPSVPVEVLGLNGTPEAGDDLNVVDTEGQAREIAEYREKAAKDKRAAAGAATTLDQLLAKAKDDQNVSELPILVKADVQGSAEAIIQAMEKIGNDEVRVRVLHSGVGAITESDIGLAEASGAPVIGFNVRANAPARNSANQKGVEIRYYSVIYDLVDDVKAAASGLLSAEIKETFIGYSQIKEVFKVSGVGKVAGCLITEGVARRSAGVRLLRDNVVIHEGTLKTLKRFKDEVAEVQSGQEVKNQS